MPTTPFPNHPVRFLLHYVARHPWIHAAVVLSVAGAASCAVGAQYGMKLLVDAMTANVGTVWVALAVFGSVIGVEQILWRLGGLAGSRAWVAVGVDMRLDLFAHLSGHAHRYFQDQFAGALANRISATATAAQAIEAALAWNILPPCAAILCAIAVLLTVQWQIAAVLAAAVGVVGAALFHFGRRGQPLHQAYADRFSATGGEIVDLVSNSWVVKAFSTITRERTRLAAQLGTEASAQRKSLVYLEVMRLGHGLVVWLLTAGVLGWAIWLWTLGQLSAGDVVVSCGLSFTVLHCSRDFALALFNLAQHYGQIADALQAIAVPHEIPDAAHAHALVRRGGSVAFEDVSFGYGGTVAVPVLDHLSLRVPAGQKVGIVGPSGVGKSTLLALVQRLYEPQRGHVRVDGQDVAGVTQESLRAAMAVVPQEISLFHRSVLENIRYGLPEATEEQVIAAAKAAQCHDFIGALPEGYDTIVGERGLKLSGGQRQRIGIARAILKDAPIILLDEATSALDTESEIAVQRALAELMRGRTVLAVAHRLSTLAAFERIVVIKDGRIIEDGAPAELRKRQGFFSAAWARQGVGILEAA
jgi:ATP-binding cassette subfamily B protein